ncbi:MAG TPA: DUF3144 domain-containing protein [Arenimonas sp.]|uniref:DUF3144 domain-containing protein n=1 Tax=Arenimonas sp. TaxID=1872635 RepID=UPI002C3D90AB|nr:DUF3144 domain-containing protein [Arenimonas sp.]HMB55646.1 DUF3144 domain-containing protein [Arenimonas sp.]
MTETTPTEQISQEFFIRVNDFIEMANRIERRFDTAHAQLAMLHAFARYSAHHYRTVVKADSEAEREQFADYVGLQVKNFILHYSSEMIGAAPAAGSAAVE